MKWLLLFSLYLPIFGFSQQSERLKIDFIGSNDSFPDCKTLYHANGLYTKPTFELPALDLPNITAIRPSILTFNQYLNIRSQATMALKYGSIEMDRQQIVPISPEEIKALIHTTPDSSRAEWLIRDEHYLLEHFQILHDAKPSDERVIITRDTTEIVQGPPQFPASITAGIIDGYFIREEGFIRIENFHYDLTPVEFRQESKRVHQLIQPQLDSLLQPFYLSNYELTIGEYQEFIKWVSDSVELHMAYRNLPYSEAKLLLNCPKSTLKNLDSTRRDQQAIQYGLIATRKKKIDGEKWAKATSDFYLPRPERFYKRPERDAAKLIYRQNERVSVSIYPDTTGFLREEIGMTGEFLSRMSWHPAYRNYPIVNLSKEQILAYCHWKQRELNKQFKEEGVAITVRPPYLREYEFAVKLGMEESYYFCAVIPPNSYFTEFKRKNKWNAFPFYQSVNYNPLNVNQKKVNSHPPSLNYQLWYQANEMPSSPFKFLNGNVSEFVLDIIDQPTWDYFQMGESQPKEPANYVVGTNYYQDAKTVGDDQFNAALYKSFLVEGESSPYVGVRLVYEVKKQE